MSSRRYFTAATIFVAASAIVSALMIGRPDSLSIFLPRSSLVPFIRTTSGTWRFTALQAARQVSLKVPLVVRLEGTNVDLGKKILAESGLPILSADNLADAAEKVVKAVKEAA